MTTSLVWSGLMACALLTPLGCATQAPASPVGVAATMPAIAPAAAEAIARAPASLSLEEARRQLVTLDATRVRGAAFIERGVGPGDFGTTPQASYYGAFAPLSSTLRYWRSGPYMVPYVHYRDGYRPFAIGHARPYYVETGGALTPHYAVWP